MAYTKVIIVGGGFAGINAARILRKSDVDILVIDKTNHHVFQPLLYQVASAALSPGNIAAPIREMLRKQENTRVIMGEVVGIDTAKQNVVMGNGDLFHYDWLILAPGADHSYFGHPEWERDAPGLKTLSDAVRIRERILLAFERAERCDSFSEAAKYLRFVIVGGGPTGVEMAGAVAEIAHKTMFQNFRRIKPEQSEIFLVEGQPHILGTYPLHLSQKAQHDLERMGVKVLTNTQVTDIHQSWVSLSNGKKIETTNVIWAAGNAAPPLLETLKSPLDKSGRVIVGPDLTLPGHPNVFVIGDAAHAKDDKGAPLPGIAPVAIQQGKYVGKVILHNSRPDQRPPFQYFDKGNIATIGTNKAVATIGKLQFSGFLAWLAWGVIHIFYLISFENRALVMMQWFFWYITGKRQSRLIAQHYNPVGVDDLMSEADEGETPTKALVKKKDTSLVKKEETPLVKKEEPGALVKQEEDKSQEPE